MSSGPVVGVFALQGDVREHVAMLRSVGARAQPVRRPEELSAVDAMILPGGESTTMYKLATNFGLSGPLQARVAEGMPVLGTCAGMILLADSIEGGIEGQQTLGGIDVVVRRNAFGRQVDSFETDVQFADFDEPLHAVFIRAPLVEKVGADVEVLAALPGDAAELARPGQGDAVDGGELSGATARIVAVRQGRVIATSFHPELASDDRVHRYFIELVRNS